MVEPVSGTLTAARRVLASLLVLTVALGMTGCSDSGTPPPAATATASPEASPSPSPTDTATPVPTATATTAPSSTATTAATITETATPIAATATATVALLQISRPADGQLSLTGSVAVEIQVSPGTAAGDIGLTLDGEPVTADLTVSDGQASGSVADVPAGTHVLAAQLGGHDGPQSQASFETVALQNPDECDVLNDAECLLPYPSSRFLEPADTPTGFRIHFPEIGMPTQGRPPHHLSPDPYDELDGFSPAVQILMHFEGGVDPETSNASRLLPETRTYSLRSLDADSPTVLLDADTGERILHFIEPDVRAPDSARQVLFLRPGKSLTPGHRYIVAVRHLEHADGTEVEPEAAFAALRDKRPTDIAAIASRQDHFEDIFTRLADAGVERSDLQLAFDFTVASDHALTSQMLSMRDQAFAWLAQQADAGKTTFTVQNQIENDCNTGGVAIWREIDGTYEVPLFLTSDPVPDPVTPGVLNVDTGGNPVQNGLTNPPFTITIPCSVLADGGTPKRPLVVGHGLFSNGRDTLRSLLGTTELSSFDYVAGATDWSGMSTPDITPMVSSFVVAQIVANLQQFRALPDRLRQGQLNTLVLARMMKTGVFNSDPAFRTPTGVGVLAGPQEEGYYFGASLGGIMGLMFNALSPDVVKANVDVPAFNFSLLLQRATPFVQFDQALKLTNITDPMQTALLMSIIEELWQRGESAAYATHITSNPLPETNAKQILMTMAWLDQQVSNQATEIAARTLGLPNLDGSLLSGMPQIPDEPGPLPSALVVYDTGSFDPNVAADLPFIPPLANLAATSNACDPHGLRGFIPDSIEQLLAYLQPGGQIQNFCNGICDAGDPSEIPYGNPMPCDPLAP